MQDPGKVFCKFGFLGDFGVIYRPRVGADFASIFDFPGCCCAQFGFYEVIRRCKIRGKFIENLCFGVILG